MNKILKKLIVIIPAIFIVAAAIIIVKNSGINRLDTIEFPEYGGNYNSNVKFVYDDNMDIDNESIASSFFVTKKDSSYISENAVQDNGYISISDEECIKKAQKEIDDLSLKDIDYQYDNMEYDVVTDLQTGEENIVSRTAVFKRIISGTEVAGASGTYITFVNDGDIKTFYNGFKTIKSEVGIKEKHKISFKDAMSECQKLNGMIDMPENADEVRITKAEYVYWEDSAPGSDNNTIQPVYKISGKAYENGKECGDFVAYEAAVTK